MTRASLLYGSFFTALVLSWLWLLDRNDRTSSSTALLTAASAGLFGNLTLHLHCAINEPQHLLLGHVAVLAVWTGAYVLMAGRSVANDAPSGNGRGSQV